MNTIIISLGGEDYSIEYENKNNIYSVQNLNGKEIELTDKLEQEILTKINNHDTIHNRPDRGIRNF